MGKMLKVATQVVLLIVPLACTDKGSSTLLECNVAG